MYLKYRVTAFLAILTLLAGVIILSAYTYQNRTRLNEITKGYTMCKIKKEKSTTIIIECLK